MTRAALCMCIFGLLAGPARAGEPECTDPSWAPKRLPGFVPSGCDQRVWDSFHVELAGGERDLEGRRAWVDYGTPDGKSVAPRAARAAFVAQAEAHGAKLMSRPDTDPAVLSRGDIWYLYSATGGNSDEIGSYRLTTIEVAPLKQEVELKPMTGGLVVGARDCGDPPWLAKGLGLYKRADCESRGWDVVPVQLASGQQEIEGRRASVGYQAIDQAKLLVPLAAQRNFAAAFKKLGAEVLSDPKVANQVTARLRTAGGEMWLIVEQAGGNEDSLSGFRLTTVQVAPLPQVVVAKLVSGTIDTSACADPPWLVKGYTKFKRGHCTNRDLDTLTVHTSDGDKVLAGSVFDVGYELEDQNQIPTSLAVQRNFVAALQKLGAELVTDPKDATQAVLHQKIVNGGEVWYIYQQAGGNSGAVGAYSLVTLQVGAPPLPKKCKIEIYGINFDFDKATLRDDSEPMLNQVLALFQVDPKLAGEIGGHTDNVGKPAYNATLSGQRAEAVKAWLVAHGIEAARLTTRGYGDSSPLVANDTDENRAKNRRVELRRKDCK
jgi:outer membrane protein OmpA-like peptidoglycan-associated protein